jgi:hypothetical protein|tara:strand:+ start:1136 stop:1345 length:210 start_codon:yes stop_codon:yes gene_type:complete
MILNDSYIYEIQQITINRNKLETYKYLQLRIKHRLLKSTLVVFTHSVQADKPDAFNEMLEVAKKMKKIY